jgi:ferrous iron transport protein A
MTLLQAPKNSELIIKDIQLQDEELKSFLFSLGCYSGEPITIIQQRKNGCIVAIKDARYNIDKQLANAIIV